MSRLIVPVMWCPFCARRWLLWLKLRLWLCRIFLVEFGHDYKHARCRHRQVLRHDVDVELLFTLGDESFDFQIVWTFLRMYQKRLYSRHLAPPEICRVSLAQQVL